MARILVADDEEKIREMIYKYATHEGYDVSLASNGLDALKKFKKEDFDVVILDIMMPELDGYKTLEAMKKIKDVHCIFLTALGQEYDRVYGFDLGCEDYVTKPFSLKELMMRIKVILKRDNVDINKHIIEDLIIDENAHMVSINNKVIDMSNKEYELLLLLVKNRGIALNRQTIISNIWGYEYDNDDRTLDTHMKLLRKDLGKYRDYITTIRGVGYRFEKEI